MEVKFKDVPSALKACGYEQDAKVDVSKIPDKHKKAIEAFWDLIVLIEANNEGKEIDWANLGQWKYAPWLYVVKDENTPSGFGLSRTAYGVWRAVTDVGSRLSFLDSDVLLAALELPEFKKAYQDFLFIPKK